VIVVGWPAVEELVRGGVAPWPTWTSVKNMRRGGESVPPERWWNVGMEEESVYTVIESA
jgi:hypothetical protein